MFSSSTPSAGQPDWHPVHRVNALLRSALLNPAAPSAASSQELGRIDLGAAWDGIKAFPEIAHPASLAEGFDFLALREEVAGPSRRDMQSPPEHRPDEIDLRLLDAGLWDGDGEAREGEAFAGDTQLDTAFRMVAPQAHVEALVHEFYRRQQRATLLVAGSLVAAVLLTFGAFLLIGSLVAHGVRTGANWPSHSSSIAWKGPASLAPAKFQLISARAKGEPLLVPAAAHATAPSFGDRPLGVQVILATSGRPLALGPLLPPSHARYLFIRGLPAEAELSAGRRSSSGAWFVKEEDVQGLALSVGDAAKGDYPVDIYTLESGDAPQARRSVVLRVETEQQNDQQVPSMDWASALVDSMPSPSAMVNPAGTARDDPR